MYDDLVKSRFKYRIDELDEIVELITELVAINKSAVKINGTDVPPELVKARFLKLNEGNIIDFFDRYENITEEIKNTRAYMISMLFNTKTTSAHYYTNQYKSDQ
ncbi:MAG: hypothetical protein IJ736_14210 [Firmicutes bacterium]|nr:hypothetical protein [Bacillota bacterium]